MPGKENDPLAPGLYIVATPIGNLGDITLRALEILKSADRIACEDTRQTQKLLNHYGISTPTISCHQHNERERALALVAELQSGSRIALVSDAGMPGISDPGGWLVAQAISAGVSVIPIPGANAAVCAVAASGFAAGEFHFVGFLPEKAGSRRTRIEALLTEANHLDWDRILVFYEAPHRILETLADFESIWGSDLRVAVARELTKLHEEFLRGSVAEVRRQLAARDRVRGEITLLVEARPLADRSPQSALLAQESIASQVARIQADTGADEKEALKHLARATGRSKSDLYRELQRERSHRPGPGGTRRE